jgi:hypothetical protein
MIRRACYLTPFLVIIGAIIVFVVPVGVTTGEPCSGEVEDNGDCTTSRACAIGANPKCLTEIIAKPNMDVCTADGALPADNCQNSTTQRLCADRFDCEPSADGKSCVTGDKLGEVKDYEPMDGGDCELE